MAFILFYFRKTAKSVTVHGDKKEWALFVLWGQRTRSALKSARSSLAPEACGVWGWPQQSSRQRLVCGASRNSALRTATKRHDLFLLF